MTRRKLALAAAAVFAAAFAAIRCDGPAEPAPSGWEYTAPMPMGCTALACGDGAVYVLAGNRIYRLDGTTFTGEYKAPSGADLTDLAFLGAAGWAVGSFRDTGFIVHYDGSCWSEVLLQNTDIEAISKVFPVNATSCWLLNYPPVSPARAFYWDGSELTKEDEAGDVLAGAYSATTSTFYGWRPKGDEDSEFVITSDGGQTWVTEEIPAAVNGYYFALPPDNRTFVAVGDALYFLADGHSPSFKTLVLKRTGPPGAGVYDISFGAPIGPNFEELDDIAFASPSRGAAVGYRTAVFYDGSRWYMEAKTQLELDDVAADPRGGFWTAAGDPYSLYYHP